MYMRFVRLKVKPGKGSQTREYYRQRVLPTLEGVQGCLFAGLLRGVDKAEDWISMTLWSTREAAEAYQREGPYRQFLEESTDFLESAVEWKVALTDDAKVEVQHVAAGPVVEGYQVQATDDATESSLQDRRLYVRLVSMKIQPGRFDEFKSRYEAEIVPALMGVPGCRKVYMVGAVKDRNQVLSVTVWDNQQKAIRYEISGMYEQLVGRLRHTFSQVGQWRMAVSQPGTGRGAGAAPEVSGYQMVAGQKLLRQS